MTLKVKSILSVLFLVTASLSMAEDAAQLCDTQHDSCLDACANKEDAVDSCYTNCENSYEVCLVKAQELPPEPTPLLNEE